MTDLDDEKTTIYAPPENLEIQNNASLQPTLIATELQRNQSVHDLEIFRTLINIKIRLEDSGSLSSWNLVIVELLRIISASDDVGEEQILLASLALVNILFRTSQLEDFTRQMKTFWGFEDSHLEALGEDFQIRDLEWFKLVLTHGYLQVNIGTIYVREIIGLPFEVLRRNCLRYTKYSYFAYKTLQTWLNRTAKTDFWWTSDTTDMETDLEAIIFSNWNSCMCEIAQRNSTQIFPTYLRIMSEKYEGFLDLIFENCMEKLSWQNELKYTILAEVCKIWDNMPKIVCSDLPSCLFTSLTKNHLKHPGTKLYLTILDKLKVNEWEQIFSESFLRISGIWESSGQLNAIELLWEQWMKPTIMKFANIFEYLSRNDSIRQLRVNRSYLEKVGDRQGLKLIYENTKICDILKNRVIDISEPVRLNAFAILCQLRNWKIAFNEEDPFAVVKRFLYFNIDTSSICMRKGIVKNFDILFTNIVRLADKDPDAEQHIHNFLHWLHEFLLDCFELGASYQRKILAMSLYEIVLILTSMDDCQMGIWNADKSRGERRKLITCAINLRKKISGTERWMYCDLQSTRLMHSLVYDPIAAVRDKATFMLLQYFCADVYYQSQCEDQEYRWRNNERYCNSSKIYEVSIGVTLKKIKIQWDPKSKSWHDRLSIVRHHVGLAENQLSDMQSGFTDILHCLVNGKPVYASLMVILEIGFLMGPVEKMYDECTIEKILRLIEDVTIFFLSNLSVKPKSNKLREFRMKRNFYQDYSSFEEMDHTIEDSTRNSEINEDTEEWVLSAAHQLLLFAICVSLKLSSEIAAEIGLIAETEEFTRRSIDLIVSILLKCRHKGAIEAAGLALAKLTKSLSKGKYNELIESRLMDLLNIDNKDNIKLTRRGAGLSIMFYRIVSSDDRRNRPWLHLAVRKLLDSLKTNTEEALVQNEDFLIESPRARHLFFLRSLVADKALQAQLVPYFEDICLTCLRHLQSSEWTVRNASLQLFGAIVPRLVGQCSATGSVDYGIGNSVEHFITHYPTLAETIITQLKCLTKSFCCEAKNCGDMHISSNVVPILTLLSKMSCGGCELVDYSSKNYLSEAREAFSMLFGHPVFNIRVLAGKAYAAFIPLPDIPDKLSELQLESLIVNCKKTANRKHGLYSAQLYLIRKWKHELQSTSDMFNIKRQENCENIVNRASYLQMRLLGLTIYRWLKNKERICYLVESALIKCLLESPISFSSEDLPVSWPMLHIVISKMLEECSKPGFSEFIEDLMSLSRQLRIVHDTSVLSSIFHTEQHCHEHRTAIMKNLRAENCNLQIFVEQAHSIFDDYTKSDILLSVVTSIRDTNNVEISKQLLQKICELANKLQRIDVKSRPYSRQLQKCGYCIELKFGKFNMGMVDRTMDNINEDTYDDDVAVKELSIDCLSRLINACEPIFEDIKSCGIDATVSFMEGGGQTFFEVVIAMLIDEDPEIRESIASTLQPVMKIFAENSVEPICAKACFHKILSKLLKLRFINQTLRPPVNGDDLVIFIRLANRIRFYVTLEDLESPFQQDETLNRDDTFLINILFYCARTFMKGNSPTGSNESVEVQQIDGVINAKYEIRRQTYLDQIHLDLILTIERSHYLSIKKRCLMKIIDRYRHEKATNVEDLTNNSNSP